MQWTPLYSSLDLSRLDPLWFSANTSADEEDELQALEGEYVSWEQQITQQGADFWPTQLTRGNQESFVDYEDEEDDDDESEEDDDEDDDEDEEEEAESEDNQVNTFVGGEFIEIIDHVNYSREE